VNKAHCGWQRQIDDGQGLWQWRGNEAQQPCFAQRVRRPVGLPEDPRPACL